MLKQLLKQYSDLADEIINIKAKTGLMEKEAKATEISNKIKDLARTASESEIETARTQTFYLRVDQPFKKWYDWGAIKKNATPGELIVIEKDALIVEINRSIFEKLIEEGLVRRELRTKKGVFREEKMTPRVAIVPIGENNGKEKE